MKKLLAAALCAVLAMTPVAGLAQVTTYADTAPTGERITVPVTPAKPLPVSVLGIDSVTGLACFVGTTATCQFPGTGGGGGGGSLSATASASPTPVTAGPNKPLNIGLFSNLFTTLVTDAGGFVDLTAGTAGSPAGGVSTVQGQAGMTPLEVNLRLAGTAASTNTGNANATTLRVVLASDQPAIPTSPAPSAAMGCTPTGTVTTSSTNATSVKASAGTLCFANFTNPTSTAIYFRFYDLATAPTCGSATGYKFTVAVPPNATTGDVGGIAMNLGPFGALFSAGIAYCATGGGSSTDSTSGIAGVYPILGFK